MTEAEERKLLKQLFAALEESAPRKRYWQPVAINALSCVTLTAIALWVLLNPHQADGCVIAAFLGAVLAGAMIGALSTWRLLRTNDAVVRRYIDAERVRARLTELER